MLALARVRWEKVGVIRLVEGFCIFLSLWAVLSLFLPPSAPSFHRQSLTARSVPGRVRPCQAVLGSGTRWGMTGRVPLGSHLLGELDVVQVGCWLQCGPVPGRGSAGVGPGGREGKGSPGGSTAQWLREEA